VTGLNGAFYAAPSVPVSPLARDRTAGARPGTGVRIAWRRGGAILWQRSWTVNTWHLSNVLTHRCGVTDLADLVSAAQSGDRHAFGALYGRFAGTVHGILLARVPRGEVEDLVQDVFMIAMRRLETLRDPDAFGGWLAAITRNRATDYVRRAPHTVELTDEALGREPPCGTGASPPAAAPDQSEALMVLAAIRALPEAYREPLVLRLVEGMTGPEIAQRTGLTAASVRVNLHRGMKQLRERLKGT